MRIRIGSARRKKRRLYKRLSKGYYGARHKLYRTMKEAVMRSGKHAFAGRKIKKRDMRSLWIIRINAAVNARGLNYGTFMNALKKASILINRKMLAELAVNDEKAFDKIIEIAKTSLNPVRPVCRQAGMKPSNGVN